mmetsp:Transcript_20046/g.43302  ORF Transcript_20046/g.43302 Transcript_20046/m.43302 type:complete len:213 (-) Transcript_20046:651-1289(-)
MRRPLSTPRRALVCCPSSRTAPPSGTPTTSRTTCPSRSSISPSAATSASAPSRISTTFTRRCVRAAPSSTGKREMRCAICTDALHWSRAEGLRSACVSCSSFFVAAPSSSPRRASQRTQRDVTPLSAIFRNGSTACTSSASISEICRASNASAQRCRVWSTDSTLSLTMHARQSGGRHNITSRFCRRRRSLWTRMRRSRPASSPLTTRCASF